MQEFLLNYSLAVSVLFVFVIGFYFYALWAKNGAVADFAWGLGFILVSGLGLLINQSVGLLQLVAFSLVVLWGLRLAIHIYLRNRGKQEDWRYKKWREDWGKDYALKAFLKIFLLQGLLLLIVVLPAFFIATSRAQGFSWFLLAGALVWLIGFFFEGVGDYQLNSFKSKPENNGRVMKTGLWQYTRHPNYFGEVTTWWGIYIIALAVPNGWMTIIGPLTITFLILKVSGVPMLENKYAGNFEFEQYKKTTNKFFPWFPKKLN